MIARLAAAAALGAAVLVAAVIGWNRPRTVDSWALVDALGTTSYFAGIQANSVLLAANLGDRSEASGGSPERYLSAYFSNMAGRPLGVVRDGSQAYDALSQGVPVYYCERQWLPGRRAAVLLLSRLRPPTPDSAPLAGDRVALLSTADLRNLAIEYDCPKTDSRGKAAGVCQAPVSAWRRDGTGFVADAVVPGWTPGTTRLIDEAAGNSLQVAAAFDFRRGFAQITERSSGHYFRWNDGREAEGEFDLLNSLNRPLTVRFRAVLHFNDAASTGAFDLITPAGTESFRLANGGLLERVWTLQPGSNPMALKCHESRISAPNDPRYLVFSMWDWSVEPLDAAPSSR